MTSTIIVVPRERFSSLPQTLRSLFSTVPAEQPVIVVEGATPEDVRAEVEALRAERPFELISLPYPLLPNQARNLGLARATTEFVAFCDNDVEVEAGWLDALEATAAAQSADLVAPLIFLGPREPRMVHHAGGAVELKQRDGDTLVAERHRLSNANWPDIRDKIGTLAPIETDGFEFHCVLIRRSLLEKTGGLDERMVSWDHVDFQLHAQSFGAKLAFAKDAHVTYRALDPIQRQDDLRYFLHRWSEEHIEMSFAAFEDRWSAIPDPRAKRHWYTRMIKNRAVTSFFPTLTKLLGRKNAGRLLRRIESVRTKGYFAKAMQAAPAPKAAAPALRSAADLLQDHPVAAE